MADLSYFHGVKLEESPDTPSLVRINRFGTTFANGSAPDADPAQFPLGLTLVTSLTQAAALGTAGTLLDMVTTLFGEGATYVIVNRVEHSADATTMQNNLVGDPVARTGLYAALTAKSRGLPQPRVLITAGNTGAWIEGGLVSVSVATNGEKLTEAPVVTFTGGGTDAGKVLPTAVAVLGTGVNAGKVVSITVTSAGKNMTAAPTVGFTGGGSDAGKVLPTAIANIGDVGNPFVSAAKVICPQIRARAYFNGPNTTNAAAVRWRSTLGDRILPIDPMGIKLVDDVPVVVPSAAVFAGVRARVVASSEGVSGSVSNKPIRTLDGVARTIQYPADSNYLNENSVNTIIRRTDLVTWGSRLAASDVLWQFDSVRATADMVNEALEDVYFQWVDKKFTAANLKMAVEDGNNAMRVFVLNNDILTGSVFLTVNNTPSLNAQGKVFFGVRFEPVGLMEQIHITTYRDPLVAYELLFDQVQGLIQEGPLAA
ncbi:phage tail protein [Rhizobium sp. Root149]|uniref:phage tail protein n=1 Tax=Rhizobium sp. Root149 TaxID=1736473 RepID=UPI000715ED6B|nr:phage tail protein [Rhizobium sp. Root149]KQZ54624.1 phage tail protein [Rhizobium sp. Root149]